MISKVEGGIKGLGEGRGEEVSTSEGEEQT